MNPYQIAKELDKLSLLLPRRAQEALDKKQNFDIATEALKTFEAEQRLLFKAKFPEDKEADLKAKVVIESQQMRLDLVVKEAEWQALEIRVLSIKERINALKVMAKILIIEMENIEPKI